MAAYRRVYDSVTCRLTAKNRDQLRNPTVGNRVRATFTFLLLLLLLLLLSFVQVQAAVATWKFPGFDRHQQVGRVRRPDVRDVSAGTVGGQGG